MNNFISTGCAAILLSCLPVAKSPKLEDLPKSANKVELIQDSSVCLVFAGDLMGHGPMISAAWSDSANSYDYVQWFQFISPYLSKADFSAANLEVTLAGQPYSGYPQFSSPDEYAIAAQKNGIDLLFTANNHSQDRGKAGLERTILTLDNLGIQHTGTFIDTASRQLNYPYIIEIKGIKIALMNYTYGTNGLAVSKPNVVNMIDMNQIKEDFKSAKERGAHFFIPVMHWGTEYNTSENSEQQRIASFLANEGASAIIGMHPHVVQPIKSINQNNTAHDIPVAYSLGNFISNQRDINRDGGILVKLEISQKNGTPELKTIQYLPFWVWRVLSDNTYINIKKGYYPITERQIGLLNVTDSISASLFFKNVRQILSESTEWPLEDY